MVPILARANVQPVTAVPVCNYYRSSSPMRPAAALVDMAPLFLCLKMVALFQFRLLHTSCDIADAQKVRLHKGHEGVGVGIPSSPISRRRLAFSAYNDLAGSTRSTSEPN
jgi:hypothetical protein